MSITAKRGTTREPVPAGTYPARLYKIIHFGTVPDTYMGQEKLTNKIRFINHVVDGSIPIRKVTHQVTIAAMLKCKVRQLYHDRFLAMSISSLNVERIMQLEKQIQCLTREVDLLKSMTPSQIWIRDLKDLKHALLPRKRKLTILPNNAKVICIE